MIREASASFGDASSSFAQLNNGSGFFLIEGASGHLIGQVSGEVTFNINNVSFDGNFSLSINRSNQAVNRLIRFGDELINVSLKPGPYFEISGNDVAMTAFEQTITGDFAFSQSDGLTSLRVTNAELNNADGLIKVSIPNGDFIVTSEGMSANFAVGVSFGVDGISLADGEVLDLNFSTLSEINSLKLSGGSIDDGLNLLINELSFVGAFEFEQFKTDLGEKVVSLSISGLSFKMGFVI